ncbi:MAG: hypothetical protein IK088_07985, partial [Lachnospiraceae bacterium]|nr:hypothetical protein [Lachnospiraceae bacterium]
MLRILQIAYFAMILSVCGFFLHAEQAHADAPDETEKNGKLFAGYYEDSTLTIPSSTETPYEKWVNAGILSLKMQARMSGGNVDIRLLSTVDTLFYREVGFRICFDKNGNGVFEPSEKTTWKTGSVTERINAANSSFSYRYSPKVIDTDSAYFITAVIGAVPAGNWDKAFLAEPFWVTLDGTVVYGGGRWFTVNDMLAGNTNINLSARMEESSFAAASVSGIEGASVRNCYYDGRYGHFNLTVADRTALPSVTAVNVCGTTVYYRNYQNTAAEDTSWYTVPNEAGEKAFVITTASDLYGMYRHETGFSGKTVYLVTDLQLNDVTKVDWTTGETAPGYTPKTWKRIGRINFAFTGTFDGQGHTVSGLYLVDGSGANYNVLGLFGRTYGAAVKNLKLVDSYIRTDSETVGAIVGQVENGGTFENLYSSATVRSSRAFVGGLFGKVTNGTVSITRCWFDGTVISDSSGNGKGFVGGIIGYQLYGNTILDNCMSSGHIDISGMRVNNTDQYGTGGLIGVKDGNSSIVQCAVFSTIDKGPLSGYCGSYVSGSSGMLLGDGNYRVDHGWDANYSGSAVYFGMTTVSDGNAKGDDAKSYMPSLDWKETWNTVSGSYPSLNVLSGRSERFLDFSWYDGGSEYVLDDAADLKGFSVLVNSGITFEGKTVTLSGDIVMNTGNSAVFPTEAPETVWIPAGHDETPFCGVFDGQNHAISGLYAKGRERVGLFGVTKNAVVKNLRLTNSYLSSDGQWIGSFAGQGSGTFLNLYSDAVLTTSAAMIGGIVGANDDEGSSDLTVKNCWFDGTVRNTHSAGTNSGGFTGGIAGYLAVGTNIIDNCLVTGVIDVSSMKYAKNGNPKTGGFVGVNFTNTTITKSAFLGTVLAGSYDPVNGGIHALAGDTNQRNLNASDVYAVTKNISGGYRKTSGRISYKNLGSEYPLGSAAVSMMPGLGWGNEWQADEESLPFLKAFSDMSVSTDWYLKGRSPYVLNGRKDLLGFSMLVGSGITFEGKTVLLGCDVTMNEGDASEWAVTPPGNVWKPIGNAGNPFKGTFDGQGHTISGLYASGGERIGLFGSTAKATVKDLKITNSYFDSTGQWIGSFAGQGSGSFIDLYSDAILTTSAAMIGGIVGANDEAGRLDLQLESCWFDGNLSCTHSAGTNSGAFMGGIVGHLSVGKNTLNNCLVTGNIDVSSFVPGGSGNMKTGGLIGVQNADDGTTVTKSAFLGTFTVGDNAGKLGMYALAGDSSQRNMNGSELYAMVDYNVIAGGYNNVNAGYGITYSNLGVTNFPIGSDAKTRMPALDWENVWETADLNLPVLRNAASVVIDTGWYDESTSMYVLTRGSELAGFSSLVNSGITFEGKTVLLGADVQMNAGQADKWGQKAPKRVWAPAGKADKPFRGVFDGQGHTISGLYTAAEERVGLFGLTENAVVRNLKLTNSYFSSTGQWIGSFLGQGSGTFENLYSDAILTTSGAMIGGIVGANDTNSRDLVLESCWFDGIVRSTGTNIMRGYVGGLIGYLGVGSDTVRNCLVTGLIDISGMDTAVNSGTGGFIGIQAASAVITDSVFLGTLRKGASSNRFYAVAGGENQFDLNGSDLYVRLRPNDSANLSSWQGGYYSTTGTIRYTDVSGKYCVGAKAKTAMTDLDWTNGWQTVESGCPIPKALAAMGIVRASAFTEIPVMVTEKGVSSRPEDYGTGNMVVRVSDSTLSEYQAYLLLLEKHGFTRFADNGSGLEGEVYAASFVKDNLTYSVSHVVRQNLTYLAASYGETFSPHLMDVCGSNGPDGAETKLHMVDLYHSVGNSFVIELKNGHFIIEDGGSVEDAPYLLDYLESLTDEGEKPVIEAWFISHSHEDHYGAFLSIAETPSYRERIILDGVYFTAANTDLLDWLVTSDPSGFRTLKAASSFTGEDGTAAKAYRMHLGERYYFCGVVIDVALTLEQILPGSYEEKDFNDTSTWLMHYIEGQKFLHGGDAHKTAMHLTMAMYDQAYFEMDVYAVFHH